MLKADSLKAELLAAFDRIKKLPGPFSPPIPLLSSAAANELAIAYDNWIKSSSPKAGGGLLIVLPGLRTGLATALVAPLMQGWAPGLSAYWGPVTWAGPGFTKPNPTVPVGVSSVAPSIAALMIPPFSPTVDAFAGSLASILLAGTLKIKVTATPDSGGPPAPVPIV